MRVLCLLILWCGVMIADNKTQTLSKSKVVSEEKCYSVILRGEVVSTEVKNITPSDVRLTVNLKMEIQNNGSKPVIFLESKSPELRGATLAKSPDEFAASKNLVLEYFGESVNTSSEWTILRNALNQSSPPLDKVRVLTPNESLKFEDTVSINLPTESGTNSFSDKRESWENIKQLSAVWLRAICQVWSINLEPKGNNQTELLFGKELQSQWKGIGLLWLNDIQSEPIALDLKTAVVH